MRNVAELRLDDSLDFRLVKIVTKFRCQINSQLKPFDITSEQWVVLHRLWEQDGINQKELSEKILKDQANTTRILDKLIKKGLVKRLDAIDDRRAYLIYLSDEGRAVFEAGLSFVVQVRERMERGLTDNEVAVLTTLLDKVAATM
ncbi:MarR family transcriptional regulator [Geomonas sp. Red32]|uniref:MarR family winged helix-turn-helix transcriptional regulator n=1 Tax=Geomonas sp. Red32 TaxID=2912856 RepID=UPI00202CB0CA|nr:MarR family transcriptional regulator [Geomonas sp. Red32]MCM0084365.1 MarR family transcriptional regulator [Geomonas sp. Red32]